MVEVFYESLCPDSKAFVTEQLAPTWENAELQSYLNVSLVPYGKSKTEGASPNYTFECHHGDNECLGNKFHACAIKKVNDLKLLVPFISCFMMNTDKTNTNFEDANMKCGKETKLTDGVIESIKQCSNSSEGTLLLAQFGLQTNAFENPLTSVPAVTVEGGKANNDARKNLKNSVCDKITGKKPAICSSKSDASVHSAMSIALVGFTVLLTRL